MKRMAAGAVYVEIDHVVPDWCFWTKIVKTLVKVTREYVPVWIEPLVVQTSIVAQYRLANEEAALIAFIALRKAHMDAFPPTRCGCPKHKLLFVDLETPYGHLPLTCTPSKKWTVGIDKCGSKDIRTGGGGIIVYPDNLERDKAYNKCAADIQAAMDMFDNEFDWKLKWAQEEETKAFDKKQEAELAEFKRKQEEEKKAFQAKQAEALKSMDEKCRLLAVGTG